MRLLMLALVLVLAGCSTIAGPIGEYHGSLTCKGKIALTGTGQLNIAAGIGGGQQNSFTLQGDCGEGFSITRSRERTGELPPELPVKP